MHAEAYALGVAAAAAIGRAKQAGRRIVAAGTTVVRALEGNVASFGHLTPGEHATELFIRPGFDFRVVDAMITNFHLPRSTLLMLVSAFAGRADVLRAYAQAVEHRYRFYSFGDAMLVAKATMRYVTFERYGSPEVLQVAEMASPAPGPGELLIEVEAAGISRADVMQRQGNYPPPRDASPILGLEVAGSVASRGCERLALESGRPRLRAHQRRRLRRVRRRCGRAGSADSAGLERGRGGDAARECLYRLRQSLHPSTARTRRIGSRARRNERNRLDRDHVRACVGRHALRDGGRRRRRSKPACGSEQRPQSTIERAISSPRSRA